MRALPIILVVAALATACEFPQGTTVPKEEYDAVVNAYNDLKVSAEATRDSYIEQAAAVDNILQELSQISGSTAVLRTDLEQGTARLNSRRTMPSTRNWCPASGRSSPKRRRRSRT